MLDWLNRNAGAVSGLASIVSALVTVALVILTARYVHLTRQIADVAAHQLEHIREAAHMADTQASDALRMTAIRLSAALVLLDDEKPSESQLREFSLLTDNDPSLLETLAHRAPDMERGQAVLAATGLRGLLGLMVRVQAAPAGRGYGFSSSELDGYREALRESKEALDTILSGQEVRLGSGEPEA